MVADACEGRSVFVNEIWGPGGGAADFTLLGYEALQGEWRHSSTLSLTLAQDGVDIQRHAPAALPPGKKPGPIAQQARWVPGQVWTGAENLPPLGFDPRTIQSVAGR
jgi:hypothetical protein